MSSLDSEMSSGKDSFDRGSSSSKEGSPTGMTSDMEDVVVEGAQEEYQMDNRKMPKGSSTNSLINYFEGLPDESQNKYEKLKKYTVEEILKDLPTRKRKIHADKLALILEEGSISLFYLLILSLSKLIYAHIC